ncbi:MAG: relaxase, partial [Pseudomonadota bacterium]
MILVASSRGGGSALASHLTNVADNEHVEIHDMRGFVSEDLDGAFKEAQAISRATKCKKYLFSLSLNPPQNEAVGIEVFEDAIRRIEKSLDLA